MSEDVTPYLIRHATASRLIDQGAELARAAKVMGHAGVNMTQAVYYHADETAIMNELEKAFESGRPKKG